MTMIVSGGELIVHVDSTTNLSSMRGKPKFLDDFDVQVDWRQVPGPNNFTSGWNIVFEVLTLDEGIGTRVYKRAHTTTITEELVSGGSVVPGETTNIVYTPSSGQFRVELVGSNWQTYYRTTSAASWNAIGGPYSITPTDLTRVYLYVENYTGTPDVNGAFDNFLVNSGSWTCPGSTSSSSSSSSVSSSSSSSSESSSSSSSSLSSSSSSSVSSSSVSSSSSSSSLSSSSESESLSFSSSSESSSSESSSSSSLSSSSTSSSSSSLSSSSSSVSSSSSSLSSSSESSSSSSTSGVIFRATESGDLRITEDGDKRIIE